MTTRAKYRNRLPQLDGGLFLTDGGLETTLIFPEGFDLPCFAAFVLLDSEHGPKALRDYFDRYVPMAIAAGAGFILESPTWRANPDWGAKVGYSEEALAGLVLAWRRRSPLPLLAAIPYARLDLHRREAWRRSVARVNAAYVAGDLVGLTGNYVEVTFRGPDHLRRRLTRVRVTDADPQTTRGSLEGA